MHNSQVFQGFLNLLSGINLSESAVVLYVWLVHAVPPTPPT